MELVKSNKNLTKIMVILILFLNFMKVIKFGGASFNMALSDLLLPLVLFLLIYKSFQTKFRDTFFLWEWAIALLLWLVLTGVFGIANPEIIDGGFKVMLSEGLKTLICIMYFYVGFNLLKYVRLEVVKIIWLINTFTFILFGLLWMYMVRLPQFSTLFDFRYIYYFMGTYTDANHAATFLGMNAFILLNMGISEKNRIMKLLYIASGVLSGAFIALTVSKGGVLAFLVALFVFLLFNFKRIREHIWGIVAIVMLTLVAAFRISTKFTSNFLLSRLLRDTINFHEGLSVRQALSHTALNMGLDHPLFGVGRGNYILNSKPYFEALGLDFINQIPHNTYIGLFAETGIIGLLLFFLPIMIVFSILLKRYFKKQLDVNQLTEFVKLGMPVLTVMAVQGYILNVENQRIIWLILGVFVYSVKYINFNDTIKTLHQDLPTKLDVRRLRYQVLLLIIILVFVYISKDQVYFNIAPKGVYDNYTYELPTSPYSGDVEYELAYQIVVNQKGFNQHGVEMQLVEEKEDGTLIVIERLIYAPVNGTEVISFTKSEVNSNVKLIFNNINPLLTSFSVKPVYLISEHQHIYLDRCYVFPFSKFIYSPMYRLSNNKIENSYKQIQYTNQYSYNETFLIDVVDYNIIEGKNELNISVESLIDIPENIMFLVQGIPDDISVLDRPQMALGYKLMPSINITKFDKLTKDQVVLMTFEIPNDCNYDLKFVVNKLIEGRWVPIKDLSTDLYFLEIGHSTYKESIN